MSNSQTIFITVLLVLVILGCFSFVSTSATPLKRLRRQAGDVKIADYIAQLALSRPRYGCSQIACGLVDIVERFRRQVGEAKFIDYAARSVLGKRPISPCVLYIACGLVDIYMSGKRSAPSSGRPGLSEQDTNRLLNLLLPRREEK